MNKLRDTILDALDKYKGTQLNIDSEPAREELAGAIEKALKDAAKNDTEMYLELYQ